MPYTQWIDENSSLLIAAAEGRQEKADLREESMAVSRRSFNRHARLTGLEQAPLATHVAILRKKPFCTILGLLTFLSENDIPGLRSLLLIHGILNMWLFCPLKPSYHHLVGES